MGMVDKKYLSWQDVERLVNRIADQIDKSEIKYIYGLSRGGLIPAVMLSHITGIPYSKTPTTHGKECLIVDDICDSGKTLSEWHDHHTAVLYHKPHTACTTPDIWGELYIGNSWIIYPWEKKDSDTIQDYKLDN